MKHRSFNHIWGIVQLDIPDSYNEPGDDCLFRTFGTLQIHVLLPHVWIFRDQYPNTFNQRSTYPPVAAAGNPSLVDILSGRIF